MQNLFQTWRNLGEKNCSSVNSMASLSLLAVPFICLVVCPFSVTTSHLTHDNHQSILHISTTVSTLAFVFCFVFLANSTTDRFIHTHTHKIRIASFTFSFR